ncbi:MAG TPA: glycosyltransferase [Candidatus Paceibacterota bacterium]|nr:glycosyltransferase [Candidatus Paceibacterota bacterium]
MVIVYVIDSYGNFSNGTTVTAKRSKEFLEKLGHTVRIVSISECEDEGFYRLKERKIPIVSYFARKQSMFFAKPNKEVLKKAFEGADLIHLFLPYKTSKKAIKIAKKMNIPVTAAFHMQPEHITYGMGLDRYGAPISSLIYRRLNRRFYTKVSHIHCPSEFISNKLIDKGYRNVFHVISNGVGDEFFTEPKREEKPETFNILSIGRYSKEKRQDTLFKAVAHSPYKDQIKIILAGKGPREKRLRRLANRLNLNVEFVFLSKEGLIQTIKESHLYVHPAEAEIEGISALEAIASGLVPIVAESKNSATKQFTITAESVYKVRKYKSLSAKIDYFIENPARRVELEGLYREATEKYRIENMMKLLEEMFIEAIKDHSREITSKTRKGRRFSRHINPRLIKRIFSFLLYYGIATPVFYIYFKLIRGVKIKNRKRIKKLKTGAVVVSNHVHKLDSAMNGIALLPKKPIFTSIPQNFELRVAGHLVSALGASPIPITPFQAKVFLYQAKQKLLNKKFIHVFPEGNLVPSDRTIRKFKRGAFFLAEEAKVPVIPIRIKFIDKRWYQYPFFFKTKIELIIGDFIYPNVFLNKKDSINDLVKRAHDTVSSL